jgi:quercetin dioxygenase-like cupin family protein
MERIARDDAAPVEAVDRVHLSQLAAGDRMSVQGFEVEPGAVVPRHSHDHEQVGVVVEGVLVFVVDGTGEDGEGADGTGVEEIRCGPGDTYAIPGGEPHAAENRGDETVVGYDVFSPPRLDPDWAE